MSERALPEGWREVTLGTLGQIFDGPHATPTRRDEGAYFLNIASLDAGRLDLSKSDRVSTEEFATWTRRVQPMSGDLLFSYETRLGAAALMPSDVEACLGRRMALIRPDRGVVDPTFLLYAYLSPHFQALIDERTVHGATVDRLPLNAMGDWPMRLPALTEQRAIAEVLGALDDKIAANATAIGLLDQLASARFAQALANGCEVKLGDVARITSGTSPKGEDLNELGDGVPFFQGVRDFGVRFPSNRVATTAPVRLTEPGDTLVSVRAPVGSINLAPGVVCIGRGLAAVRSKTDTPYALFHALRGPGQWEMYDSGGTVFGSINGKELAALRIAWPLSARDLESDISSLELRLASLLRESAALTATRDALLPALMSGRITVRGAQERASLPSSREV